MTTQTEALKLALEALETYHGYMEPLLTVFGGPRVPAEKSTTYKVEKAITAIKEALAVDKESLTIEAQQNAKRVSNEQVEQKPVAWLIEYEACAGGMNRGSSLKKFDYVWHECSFVSENKDAEIDATKWRNRKETPLYTTPPVPYVVEPRTAQPKEPEQEPVAEVIGVSMLGVNSPTGKHINALVDLPIGAKLYTIPPTQQSCLQRSEERAYKPLTDEQIEAIWRDGIYSEGLLYEFNLFARAIEAVHGIKE